MRISTALRTSTLAGVSSSDKAVRDAVTCTSVLTVCGKSVMTTFSSPTPSGIVRRAKANPVAETSISILSPLKFRNSNVPSTPVMAEDSEEPCFSLMVAPLTTAFELS